PTELRAYLPPGEVQRVTPTRSRSGGSRPQRVGLGLVGAERSGRTAGPSGRRQLVCRGKRDPHSEDPPWPRKSDRRPSLGRSRASFSQSSRLTNTGSPHHFDDAKSAAPSSLRKQGSRAEQSDSCFRRNDGAAQQ